MSLIRQIETGSLLRRRDNTIWLGQRGETAEWELPSRIRGAPTPGIEGDEAMSVDPDLQAILEFLSRNEHVVVLSFIVGGGIIWVVAASIVEVFKSIGRERTRREIAAYIAEGSMTPDQGERLLRAGEKNDEA